MPGTNGDDAEARGTLQAGLMPRGASCMYTIPCSGPEHLGCFAFHGEGVVA